MSDAIVQKYDLTTTSPHYQILLRKFCHEFNHFNVVYATLLLAEKRVSFSLVK